MSNNIDDGSSSESTSQQQQLQKTYLNERQFILKSLEPTSSNIRVDGRQIYDYRPVQISFDTSSVSGHCLVKLGQTQVIAHVSCDITEPFPERPTEGFLQFAFELHTSLFDRHKNYPAALQSKSPANLTQQNLQELSIEWSRVIDRSLRGSRAIDTEALCLVAGEKVWSLKVTLNVLDLDGNVLDCAHIAAITALLHFRRPEVTIEGENVIVHSVSDREPVPLSVHHIPICVTFGFFERDRLIKLESLSTTSSSSSSNTTSTTNIDELVCVDPCLREELMVDGTMTIAVNGHGELCAIQKGGGLALKTSQIIKCAKIAAVKAQEVTSLIKKALSDDEIQRKLDRLPQYAKAQEVKKDPMDDDDDDIMVVDEGLSDISEEADDVAFEADLDDFMKKK
jgi:exosome complex component RRP45